MFGVLHAVPYAYRRSVRSLVWNNWPFVLGRALGSVIVKRVPPKETWRFQMCCYGSRSMLGQRVI